MNPLRWLGGSVLAAMFGIAEVFAIVFSAIVVTLLVVASFIVRAGAAASERRRHHRGRPSAA